MQAGMLALIFLTLAYAPMALLQGWLKSIAQVHPVTQVLEAARHGFVGMATLLGAPALREMRRTAV
jgi:hypothetical protein